ncbi:hypothetical protein LTR85_005425 [Meristemomyces frigidus]|nr:hypothetical protein LTR85_005425 [Meristemomyces frigidus]
MDSRAYLTRQGWRGDGHSLDHTDRGISKPLLVSKKVDVLGVGLNKHAAVSDQWWLRAYDQGLKDFGTGTQSALANVQKHGVSRGGLYGRFVKGEGVPGTFGEDSTGSTGDEIVLEGIQGMSDVKAVGEMAGQKRKREDKAEKKSARRKTEDKQPDEDGEGIPAEAESKRTADIDHQANRYVREAQRLGIISAGPSDLRTKPSDASSKLPGFDAMMAKVLADVGSARTQSTLKGDEYKREKLKRAVRRAAKAYLLGEDTGTVKKRKKEKRVARKPEISAVKAEASGSNAAEAPEANLTESVSKPRKLSSAKLAEYTKRANDKGLSVEAYIARREQKYAAKQAEKSKREPEHQDRMVEEAGPEGIATPVEPASNTAPSANAPAGERPLFVIDTAGTELRNIDPEDPNLGLKATSAIGRETEFAVVDAAGNESLRWAPGMPIPLDPRIWAGVKPNELPKIVRKVRKDWMAVRREEKKQRKLAAFPSKNGGVQEEKKAKGQVKVEKRELFVRNILNESRRKAGGSEEGSTSTIDGVDDVPLVKVGTSQGAFTKDEVARARTVARRTLRMAKREDRAAKGKEKGYKKRDKAATLVDGPNEKRNRKTKTSPKT